MARGDSPLIDMMLDLIGERICYEWAKEAGDNAERLENFKISLFLATVVMRHGGTLRIHNDEVKAFPPGAFIVIDYEGKEAVLKLVMPGGQ